MPNLAVRHGAGVVALATRGLDEAPRGRGAPSAGARSARWCRCPSRSSPRPRRWPGSGPGLVAVVAEGLEEGARRGRPDARSRPARWSQAVLAGHRRPAGRRHRSRRCCDSVSAPRRAPPSPASRCSSAAPCGRTSPTRCWRLRANRAGGPADGSRRDLRLRALHGVHHPDLHPHPAVVLARRPRRRAGPRAFWDFCHQSTDWFLNFFRRLIPPLGMFDLSPILAIIVLYILRSLVLSLPGQLLSDACPSWITLRDGGVTVAVKAVPRSRATRAVGVQDGALRVQIAAPPHAGAVERGPLRLPGRGGRACGRRRCACAGARAGARKLIEVDGDPGRGRRAAWWRRSSAAGRARERAPDAPARPSPSAIARRHRRQTKARWWRFARARGAGRRARPDHQGDHPRPSWTRARGIEVIPGFSISRVANEGIAFGLFPGRQAAIAVLTVVALSRHRDRAGGPGGAQPDGGRRRRPAGGRQPRQPDRPPRRTAPSPTSSTSPAGRRSTSPTAASRSARC